MTISRPPLHVFFLTLALFTACSSPHRLPSTLDAGPALFGDTLSRTLDNRFGIWFVGEPFPATISLILPSGATAAEATESLYRAFEGQSDFYLGPVSNSPHGTIFQIWRADGDLPAFRYGEDPADVPLNDDTVTQIVPLKAYEFSGSTTDSLLARTQRFICPSAKITLLGARHCVLVTDSSANLHCTLETLSRMRPPLAAHHVIEFRLLEFLSAPQVARDINRQLNLPPDPAAAATQAQATGSLYADADPRTNIVVLNGPATDVSWVVDRMNRMEDAVEQASLLRRAATRPAVTTPLSGAPLVAELDARYGIWLVGAEQLPAQVTVPLPDRTTANSAIYLLGEALERDKSGFHVDSVAGAPDFGIYVLRPAADPPHHWFFGCDPDIVPLTQDVITQIIPLYDQSAADFLETFQTMLAGASVASSQRHHCVLITDTSARIHSLLETMNRLQIGGGKTVIENRHLQNLNSSVVARELNTRFGLPPTRQGTQGGQPPSSSTAATPTVKTRLYADWEPRTNTVVLVGPAGDVTRAMGFIDQMEATAEQIAP